MTFPFTFDIDILPLDLNAKMQVCPSSYESDTDAHTDDVKTITPDTSQTWIVKTF